MNEPDASEHAITAAIEAATAGRWGAWRSDTGWWWAARTHALSARDLSAGCVPFLHADNPDELAERIRQQDHLSQTASQESDTQNEPEHIAEGPACREA